MPIQSLISPNKDTITIRITGRFDFSVHGEFRNTYKDNKNPKIRFVLDLKDTQYLDSSALGMLLLLREHVGNDSHRVEIVNCTPDIRKILTIANFQQLFTIH